MHFFWHKKKLCTLFYSLNAFFCRKNRLRTSSRIFCALKVAIRKVQTFWASGKQLFKGQKWFLGPYFPLIGGIFVLKIGLRFSFRVRVRKRPLSPSTVAFSSLSDRPLPVLETKITDHFSIQIYPQIVGNIASETTFDPWKVVFS